MNLHTVAGAAGLVGGGIAAGFATNRIVRNDEQILSTPSFLASVAVGAAGVGIGMLGLLKMPVNSAISTAAMGLGAGAVLGATIGSRGFGIPAMADELTRDWDEIGEPRPTPDDNDGAVTWHSRVDEQHIVDVVSSYVQAYDKNGDRQLSIKSESHRTTTGDNDTYTWDASALLQRADDFGNLDGLATPNEIAAAISDFDRGDGLGAKPNDGILGWYERENFQEALGERRDGYTPEELDYTS